MAQELTASVGRGGVNRPGDVANVQTLLNDWIRDGALKGRVPVLTSGKCDGSMIEAIGTFQKVVARFRNPDYRIDPNGRTWAVLSGPVTTTPQNLRTDHTAREVYAKRARAAMRRGDKYVGSSGDLLIEFDSDFDEFAARVAYALRHLIIYRTDDGKFARGLVRASKDLEIIHDAYLAYPPPEGMPIRLNATLWRRRDPAASNRWVMSIRFRAPDWVLDEGEVVRSDSDRMEAGREKIMAKLVGCAAIIADDIPGDAGDRIRKMVEIADRVGYPRNVNLWFYNPDPVREFISWRTDNKRRRLMTSDTDGKLPFDGYAFPMQWRVKPFETIFRRFASHDLNSCAPGIRPILINAFEQINRTYRHIQKEKDQVSTGGGDMFQGAPRAFLQHMNDLQNDQDHLYSAWKTSSEADVVETILRRILLPSVSPRRILSPGL